MNKVYIVLYEGNVSSEGYDTVDKAIEFIKGRSGNPKSVIGYYWIWKDIEGNEYQIREIDVK